MVLLEKTLHFFVEDGILEIVVPEEFGHFSDLLFGLSLVFGPIDSLLDEVFVLLD